MEVVGWGVSPEGTKFWKVRNSWGSYWGTNSFFLIERGVNALQLEAGDCWYAQPSWQMEKVRPLAYCDLWTCFIFLSGTWLVVVEKVTATWLNHR